MRHGVTRYAGTAIWAAGLLLLGLGAARGQQAPALGEGLLLDRGEIGLPAGLDDYAQHPDLGPIIMVPMSDGSLVPYTLGGETFLPSQTDPAVAASIGHLAPWDVYGAQTTPVPTLVVTGSRIGLVNSYSETVELTLVGVARSDTGYEQVSLVAGEVRTFDVSAPRAIISVGGERTEFPLQPGTIYRLSASSGSLTLEPM